MEKSEYALPSLPTIAPRSFCKAHILVSLRQTTGHVRPGPLRGVGNTEQTLAGGYRVVGMRQTPSHTDWASAQTLGGRKRANHGVVPPGVGLARDGGC